MSFFHALFGVVLYIGNGLLPAFRAEDCTARNQPIGPCLGDLTRVVDSDAPVDLNVQLWEFFAQLSHLFHHVRHELLSPEARLDSHHQHFVHSALTDQLLNGGVDGRFGAQG